MSDHRPLVAQVKALLQKGEAPRAVELLLSALRARPDDLDLRSLLGSLYARLGHLEAGIECYRVVAGAQASLGNLLGAVAACRAILQLDPLHTETQALLADLYAHTTVTPTPVMVPAPRPTSQARGDRRTPVAQPSAPRPPLRPDWDDGDADVPVVAGEALPEPTEGDRAQLRVNPGALPRVPLFSDLSKAAFVWLLPRLEARFAQAGEVIASEGDFGDSLFIVLSGTVRFEKRRADGPPLLLNRLGPNTFFGEIALLGSGVRSASAVADTDTELFELTRDTLDELAEQHPSVTRVMRRFYKERLFSDLLKTSPLFRALEPGQVREFAGRFKGVEAERGTRLQVEGKRSAGLHVVLEGRCEVSRTVDGRRVVLSELGAGDVFGGAAFLTGEPAATTVTARVRTTALCLPPAAAPALLAGNPKVRKLLELVADGGEKVMDSVAPAAGKGGKAAAPRHLQGDLAQLRPPSLLVFFEMERMTGVLRLERGKERAALFIKSGRILDVEAPAKVEKPVERLGQLLAWDQGSFDFTFEDVEREDRVRTGTTGLLLEAARVADEAARDA